MSATKGSAWKKNATAGAADVTAAAKVACAACHGDVKAQAKIEVHRSTKMAACVDCHKEHKATVACNACHELGQ